MTASDDALADMRQGLTSPTNGWDFFFFFSYKVVNLFLEAESSAHKA